MSAAATATMKQSRGPKTRGTEWWDPPPDTPLNLGIPYVVSIVDDGLSLAQSRVLAAITDTRDGARRQEREIDDQGRELQARGFLCDPGGYSRIARKCGLCRKTVYNAIRSLIRKGVLRIWNITLKGRQRVKTLYFALHYGDILPVWRAEKKWFHTAHKDSVVVRKRSKQFVTVEEAREWRMNPQRAPKKGCGRGLTEVEERLVPEYASPGGRVAELPAAPAINDDDIEAVHFELLRQTDASCIQDAIDVINDARREAKKMGYEELGYGGPLPGLTVADLVQRAGASYKATPRYPRPTPGWFLGGQIRRQVANWLKYDWEQKQG